MYTSPEYYAILNEIRSLTQNWSQTLKQDEWIAISSVIEQDEGSLDRLKKLSPQLQEHAVSNYLSTGCLTRFSIYLSAIELCNENSLLWRVTPNISSPIEFYRMMEEVTGIETKSPEFMTVLNWFGAYLGRSSTLVLYTLRSKYSEQTITEMAAKLDEFKIDPRVIDIVKLVADWESENLSSRFNIWTHSLYRYRELPDEGVSWIPLKY